MKEKLTKMVIDAVYFSFVILLAVGSAYQGSEFCKTKGLDVTVIEETIQTPLLAVLAEITSAKPAVIGFADMVAVRRQNDNGANLSCKINGK